MRQDYSVSDTFISLLMQIYKRPLYDAMIILIASYGGHVVCDLELATWKIGTCSYYGHTSYYCDSKYVKPIRL